MSSELSLLNEYAMSNGWDLNVFPKNTWTPAQNQRYNEWAKLAVKVDSDYSNMTQFAGTTYEPPQQTAWSQQNWQPGRNRVITTNDQAGVRRRANTMDFGAGAEDQSADQILARTRATMAAQAAPDEAEQEWEDDDAFDREQEGGDEQGNVFEESTKPITEQPDVFYDEPLGGRTTRVVEPIDVEMQPIGASRRPLWEAVADEPFVTGPVEPYTVGEIRPFNVAEPWSMPNATASNIVNDLEAPLLQNPKLDLSELQGMVPAEEFEAALSESFVGYNSFGFPELNVKALASGLGGAAAGVVTQLLLNELKKTGRAGEDTSNMIQVVGGVGALLSGSGIGMVAGLGYTAITAYMTQQARITSNDYAGDTGDTRTMMVLDNGKWYPGILKSRLKGEGLMDSSNDITVAYGRPEDLRFEYENGKYRGHFINQKNKQFRMDDSEWSGEKSTLAWNENKDFMRPFYFLSQQEGLDMLKGYGTKDFAWKILDQDTTNFSPIMKDYSDLQAAMDFMQNSEIKTADPSTFLISDSKSLRKTTQLQFETATRFFEDSTYLTSKGFPQGDEAYGLNTKWDSYKMAGKQGLGTMHNLNKEVITRKMTTLGTTRKLAAESSGVDWRVYNDYAKDLPVADSISALKNQYAAIGNYTDRNDFQKQYLQEKAGVRYLMGVSNRFGYGADLYDVMWAGTEDRSEDKAAEQNSGDRTYMSDNDILPGKYWMHVGASALQSTPAWLNEGETPLGSILDLAGWQDGYEAEFAESNKHFRDLVISEVGYDPEELIKEHGSRMNAINVQKELERQIQHTSPAAEEEDLRPAAPAPKGKRKDSIKSKGTIEQQEQWAKERAAVYAMVKPHTSLDRMRGQHRVKGYKAEWREHQAALRKEWEGDLKRDQAVSDMQEKEYREDFSSPKLATHYADTNEKITYSSFLQRVQEPAFNPNNVGVTSYADMLLGLLQKSADWVPHNLALDEHNLPAKMVAEKENHFKPFLEMLDDMPDLKGNANRLHDLVYAPATQEYMERYHPSTGMTNDQIAKDYSGVELFDDWSLPFVHKQNSVMVNHHIHTRMDFGFDEI